MEARAVFLDKDGTLINDVPYNVASAKIVLADDCLTGLKQLQESGFKLIVISNQAGIARGYFDTTQLSAAFMELYRKLRANDIKINAFYYCPHHPEGTVKEYATSCNCRKPECELLLEAAKDFKLDLQQCWMVGDILNDVEAGKRAGCSSILINNGNETEWLQGQFREPDYQCANINQAADFILKHQYTNRKTAVM